ncbi:MAG: ligand-binding sensor domain-containing protein, partial [bacterium]
MAQYSPWKSFTTADGLGDVQIYTIFEDFNVTDTTSVLWFGTRHGVTRFDGQLTNFTQADGLVNDSVLAVARDSFGRLWFGTNRGVSFYEHGKFTTGPEILTNETIHGISQENGKSFWIAASRAAFHLTFSSADSFSAEQFTTARNAFRDILVDKDGVTWFATLHGLFFLDKRGELQPAPGAIGTHIISDLFEDLNKDLWAATIGYGVWRLHNGMWLEESIPLLPRAILAIEQDWDGNYWFGTMEQGIKRYNGHSLDSFSISDFLPDNRIQAIREDGYRNLWFGTRNGGVLRYNGTWEAFEEIHTREGRTVDLSSGRYLVKAIETDQKRGQAWFGFNGIGVLRFDQTGWAQSDGNEFDTCAHNEIYAIENAADGTTWFGTRGWGGGVSFLHEMTWATIKAPFGPCYPDLRCSAQGFTIHPDT